MSLLWALLLTLSVAGAARRKPPLNLAVQIYGLEACKDVQSSLVIHNFTSVREKSGVTMYNAQVVTSQDMKSISKLEIKTTQCVDAVSYNTCSYLNTFRFAAGLCSLMTANAVPWSTLIKALHPSFRCPLPAGTYDLQNGTINMDAIVKMAGPSIGDVLNKIYVPEMRISNEKNELFGCFKFKASFVNLRT